MTRFRLLGPVGADLGGKPLVLRGPKQRALLAMLLLQPGEVVSRDRLIEGLWGEQLPGDSEHALDAQVSALRRSLTAVGPERLARRAPGYVLRVDPEELDVTCFDAALADGNRLLAAGEPEAAAERLRDALNLWEGPALADVQDAPFAVGPAAELEERRLQAIEIRAEAELQLGAGPELIDELDRLVQANPLREWLIADLALALYRAGQQARALETLAAARRRLSADLGIEPSARIRELEGRILRQDPLLRPAGKPVAVPRAQAPPRAESHTAHRLVPIAALLALVLVASFLAGDTTRRAHASAPDGAAVIAIDPSSGQIGETVPLATTPAALVAAADGVWAAEPDENVVLRLPTSGSGSGGADARVVIPSGPGAVATGDGAVWAAGTGGGTVSRIDPSTQRVTQTVAVGGKPTGMAYDGHKLWVVSPLGQALTRIDPATGRVERALTMNDPIAGVATDGRTVWATSPNTGAVVAVDGETGKVLTTVHVGGGPSAITVGGGSVWVADSVNATVLRLDVGTGQLESTIRVGSGPADLTYVDGSLWVASEFARSVSHVSPARNAVTRVVPLPSSPTSLAMGGGRLWVGMRPDLSAHRGGTLTLLASNTIPSIDPAMYFGVTPHQFAGLAYDGLLSYRRVSGPAGQQYVPDLAVGLPTSTASGTSYTFRLRPDLRYSTGAPVHASDFRRGIERMFLNSSTWAANFDALLGSERCRPLPGTCSLARAIVTDDDLGTIEFRLRTPDPSLPVWLALPSAAPVPPGTPMQDSELVPIPGTGPYRIVSATSRQVRLERNPYFRNRSPAAQPDGLADVIVWRFGVEQGNQISTIEAGNADWAAEGIPPNLLAEIGNHRAGQLHVNDAQVTDFLTLNTQKPPFNDVRVRQALNLAMDRNALLQEAYGGPDLAAPTCQLLPPNVAGRAAHCSVMSDL
ncbi:MAG TPA: ABC transporter substrate-binding protein, partial [Frankiaceae bacterium]|nr:ABC transporter substrate-binding protein [Frankiaceae bacterium]